VTPRPRRCPAPAGAPEAAERKLIDDHELVDQQVLHLVDAAQPAHRGAGVVLAQRLDRAPDVIDDQLEPQFADLMHDDEGQLRRGVFGARPLQAEQLVKFEVLVVSGHDQSPTLGIHIPRTSRSPTASGAT
jgi:hypothetical protein